MSKWIATVAVLLTTRTGASHLPFANCSGRQPQKFSRLGIEHNGKFSYDPQAGVKHAFLQLAQIAATDLSLICEFVLRQTFRVSQAAKIRGEDLS